jgi:hypothetical protein
MAGDQLLDAVEREDLQAARRLLASGANPHTDSWGMSLLEEAIRRRSLAMARLLVKHGANAQELESDGRDRPHRAASGGDDRT